MGIDFFLLKRKDRAKFFRDFYGYQDKSNFSKYNYQRGGFLQTYGIVYIKLNRAVMIIHSKDKGLVVSFLKRWGKVIIREVILSKRDQRKLFSNIKEEIYGKI